MVNQELIIPKLYLESLKAEFHIQYKYNILYILIASPCLIFNKNNGISLFNQFQIVYPKISLHPSRFALIPKHPGSFGVRCSSMVRVCAHGVMGRQINPSWLTNWAISRSSWCSTTGVTKVVVCVILFLG